MSAPGAFFAGCAGEVLTEAERAFFREAQPFGFILFARNIANPAQLGRLTASLREAVGRDALVMIDQEGGRVARMTAPHWRDWPAPLDQAVQAGDKAEGLMALRYRIIAAELRAVGIDGNCVPCADVARRTTHAVLRNRCYSSDPDKVARIARAVAGALLESGVLPVVKHVPGHGAATVDSHLDLPRVDLTARRLADVDFRPFKALADLPMAMTAHVVYTALDPDAPATTSPRMHRLIRQELGIKGLLMTDDISMKALAGSMAERCTAALSAGCDVILHCNGDMDEMMEVAGTCGVLKDKALARADAALARRGRPVGNLDALQRRWDRLVGEMAG